MNGKRCSSELYSSKDGSLAKSGFAFHPRASCLRSAPTAPQLSSVQSFPATHQDLPAWRSGAFPGIAPPKFLLEFLRPLFLGPEESAADVFPIDRRDLRARQPSISGGSGGDGGGPPPVPRARPSSHPSRHSRECQARAAAIISRTLQGRMVELCELKIMDEMEWPADMDQHIAQLDFERSMDADESNSLFSSMALDRSFKSQLLISTDSLDMDRLRERCLTNKNDYKLTFAAGEESGHWATSSQLGDAVPSPSPSAAAAAGLTTWGRIRSAEPPPDDRTSSLPDLAKRPATVGDRRRPTSLLATFVERQPDYEYSELYMGNGRYVDVNDNEIGFVPESTAPVQRPVIDRWQAAVSPLAPPRPRRTFADLQGARSPTTATAPRPSSASAGAANAPELNFLAMSHEIPSFCGGSSLSLSQMMERVRLEGAASTRLCLDTISDNEKLDASVLSALDKRDSGLGCSGGPVHIEDWPSLAVLLPKNVVDACSFFKSNSRLLTGSSVSATTPENSPASVSPRSNNIEAKKRPSSARNCATTEACRTCFSVRRRLQPPTWAQPANLRRQLCDCTTSEVLERSWTSGVHSTTSMRERDAVARLKLHATELSIVGLPIYGAKRLMVERVVEGVAEIARGGTSTALCEAMEAIVADGLFQELHPWNMITAITASGPATANIHAIMKELDASEKPLNSRVLTFFKRLLRLRSLDCWLSYVVLKENVLERLYTDSAFLLRASSAYRSLLWRLVESLELLSVIERRNADNLRSSCSSSADWGWNCGASRLPSDSRVPKSSSMPARLSPEAKPSTSACSSLMTVRTPRRRHSSRIPVLLPRPRLATKHGAAAALLSSPIASVVSDLSAPGLLPVDKGERVRVLSTRGPFARCFRMHRKTDRVMQGLIPTSNLIVHQ
uniref:RUN domain-containing protein n=1 Tax=Steinernema glaseri TaxID=37863 RepID=A0A1I7Y6R5_9BILA